MTEREAIQILSNWTDKKKFPWQLANSFIYDWECDFWTMTTSGETREFEIKISRSDFLIDAKKPKHSCITGANYFYYVCPENLFTPKEVDKRYGLIYLLDRGGIRIVKRPIRLHNNEFHRWKELANKMYWKYRELWREKWIAEEITRDEYFQGFNIELLSTEQDVQASVARDDASSTDDDKQRKRINL